MRKTQNVLVFADRTIRAALAKTKKRREFRLTDTRGNAMDRLIIDVLGGGSCSWRAHYDVLSGGRRVRRKLIIGNHTSALHAVRSAWLDALKALDEGRDPEIEKRVERTAKAERETHTFKHLCEDFLAFKRREGKRTVDEDERMFAGYVLPLIGMLPAAEVNEHHVESVLAPITGRGALVQATAVLVLLKNLFNFARRSPRWKRAGVLENPAADIARPAKPKARTRRLSDEEIRSFWQVLDRAEGRFEPATALGLKLALVLGRRTDEIVEAPWSEFELERADPRWTIPVERNKSREVIIPLGNLALQLLADLRRLSGASPFLFPSRLGPNRPSDEGLLRRALARLFEDGLLTCPTFSPHDFRRTMARRMEDELDVAPHVVDAALGHVDGTVRGRHYSQAKRIRQLRAAYEAYEHHLLRLVNGETQ